MKTIINFKSIESFSTERLTAFRVTADDLEKFVIMQSDTDSLGRALLDSVQKLVARKLEKTSKVNGFTVFTAIITFQSIFRKTQFKS